MSEDWTNEALEDILTDAIVDSLDMDWNARDGAKSVLHKLKAEGLQITVVPDFAATHRSLAAKETMPEVAAAHIRFAEQHEARGPSRDATEDEAEKACKRLKAAIDAAENSNQAGENAVVRAALAL